MPGGGNRPGITIVRGAAVLLDITRLISRVGYGQPTGIDRVETAYLDWCLATTSPFMLLVRLASGYAFLDRTGAIEIRKKLNQTAPWGRRDFRAVIGRRTKSHRGRAEADIRRLAVKKGAVSQLRAMLADLDISDHVYLNVGHSNVTEENLSELKAAGLACWIMLHDLIPRKYPQFQRSCTATRFKQKLMAVERHGDVILTNSRTTQDDCRAVLKFDRAIHSVPLGTRVIARQRSAQSTEKRPYFITIGTIEPRKNYAFLLDIWDGLGPSPPDLHIVGRRGWADQSLFQRLDVMRAAPWFHEHNDLDDTALDGLLAGACAFVYPTLAEGFGLPSLEAASLGVPVICGDLAIHRELLADYPVYASLNDIYVWQAAILDHATGQADIQRPRLKPPSWADHFKKLNNLLSKTSHLK